MCDSPRWHGGRLWLSDLYGGSVYTVSMEGVLSKQLEVEGSPSGLGFLDDGSWLVVSQRDQKILRVSPDGTVETYVELAPYAINLANDMVVDSKGRLYVGSFGFDITGDAPFQSAPILRVDLDRSIKVVAGGLSFPNGMLLNEAEDTLFVAQTVAKNILAFDVERNGALTNKRIWADLGEFRVDGICLDEDGGIWAGTIEECAFIRFAEGGRILDRIETEDRWAIAPMLGGQDGKTLFMLTTKPENPKDLKGHFDAWVETTTVQSGRSGKP